MIRECRQEYYEVSKWTHGSQPTAVYHLEWTDNYILICTCPAHNTCKHTKMVVTWILTGKPQFIAPDTTTSESIDDIVNYVLQTINNSRILNQLYRS